MKQMEPNRRPCGGIVRLFPGDERRDLNVARCRCDRGKIIREVMTSLVNLRLLNGQVIAQPLAM